MTFYIRYTRLNNGSFSQSSNSTRSKIILLTGIVCLLACTTSAIGVSWYASEILSEYYKDESNYNRFKSQQSQSTRHVYGYSLYIGWASMGLSAIAALTYICGGVHTLKHFTDDIAVFDRSKLQVCSSIDQVPQPTAPIFQSKRTGIHNYV